VVALFRWGGSRPVEPGPITVRPHPPAEDAAPTLLTYQRALARSPEDLDALLDKQAVTAPGLEPELVPISFSRFDAGLHDLPGED
jgi:hypothetical protein